VGLLLAHSRVVLLVALVLVLGLSLVWLCRRAAAWRRLEALRQLDLIGVDAMDPRRFEQFVAELLAARGYQTRLTQASHDFGVDVVAWRGSERLAVQVKHYSSAVSGKAIGEVLLGMPHYDCNACMVVTNSCFTKAAIKAAAPHPCSLIDRQQLAVWLQELRHSHHSSIQPGQVGFTGVTTNPAP
jgi:restriction system protein